MKKLPMLLALSTLLYACASTNKMYDKAFSQALIGQNEKTIIYTRLGTPSKTIPGPNGGKILIYEFYNKGMFLTPDKTNITYNTNKDVAGDMQGWTFTSNVNKVTNDPQYTIYQQNVSYLKVYIDKQGNCVRYEQNLPQEQLDIYHERFKHFISKDR